MSSGSVLFLAGIAGLIILISYALAVTIGRTVSRLDQEDEGWGFDYLDEELADLIDNETRDKGE